jgi:hypothetical protein
LVTAYGKILALADTLDNTNDVDKPDFTQYALIGVQNVNSIGASLLGDVIDLQARTSVETVAQIQNLANAVMAVLDQAKGSVGLTQIQLEALVGVWNGAADALPAVLQAIANTANDGAAVDTLDELQNVVNTVADNAIQALGVLQNFADQNSASKPTPVGGFAYQGSVPSVLTYTNAGITGVTATHLDAINDALATSVVTSNRVPTIASLQSLVNAYRAITTLADGFPNTLALVQPDADAYDWIGVTGLEPSNSDRIHAASLLSDVIDRKGSSDIDTVLEIQALADAVTAVMDVAAGGTNLTLSQLSALGFNNVPADKLDRIKTALQQTADDGSDVNTYANLSALITAELDAAQQALQRISSFALNNQQPYPSNVIGVAPTTPITLDG